MTATWLGLDSSIVAILNYVPGVGIWAIASKYGHYATTALAQRRSSEKRWL